MNGTRKFLMKEEKNREKSNVKKCIERKKKRRNEKNKNV